MILLNDIHFPVLRFLGEFDFFQHPAFAKHVTKPSKDLQEEIKNTEQFRRIAFSYDQEVSIVSQSAGTREKWPLFAILKSDYKVLEKDQIAAIDHLLQTVWVFLQSNKKKPELVTRDVWDDMYYKENADGFDKWLEKKAQQAETMYGIMIRPEENITEFYYIQFYPDGTGMEISFGLTMNVLLYFHCNHIGFLSKDSGYESYLPQLRTIAASRKITVEQAFFQEDIYNVLRYIFYREKNMLQPRTLKRGDVIDGLDHKIAVYTDVPIEIYSKNITS